LSGSGRVGCVCIVFPELFAFYGEDYFLERDGYDGVPLSDDYDRADEIIKLYIETIERWQRRIPTFNNVELQRDLWELILYPAENWQLRVRNALPSGENTTVADLKYLMVHDGGTKRLYYNETVKDHEWMQKNGQCMDNLRPGRSSIPHSGRGAFASRFIPKGGLVSPSPLVHIPNRTAMQIYKEMPNDSNDPTEKHNVRNTSAPIHHQLILNYCWGDKHSSLLLCPYGHITMLIQHQSKNPNTKLVWSERMRHPEWLTLRVEEWGHVEHTGLSIDYVAVRDIQEGEEITIDYGQEWEEAWQNHTKAFESSPPRPNYIPGFEWNQGNDEGLPPIPTISDPPEQQLDGVLLTILEDYLPSGHGVRQFRLGVEGEEKFGRTFFLCRVVEHQENGMYTVEVFERPDGLHYDASMDVVKMKLQDVPRQALFFQDVPYGRSHHQSWSFRHDMRMPNDLFPEIWRNMKSSRVA
jgi:SET domain